jgi:hypothetical protein
MLTLCDGLMAQGTQGLLVLLVSNQRGWLERFTGQGLTWAAA